MCLSVSCGPSEMLSSLLMSSGTLIRETESQSASIDGRVIL